MQDKYEVLTMEQLNSLIGKACECISVANNKTKVKLRKIIQNEAFECLNEEPSDLIKAIDILWSEQPEDAVVIKTINEWKLEGIKVIEDENLVIKIIDKENVCDETRSLFPGCSYDYIVEVSVKGFTTTFSKDFSMVECFKPLVWDEGHEGRADYTIGEALNGYGKKIYSLAEKFCLINMVGLEVTEKLLKVAKVNYQLTLIIIKNCQKRLIEDSNYVEIVDSLKSLYEQEMNIKPREKGFKFYLEGIFEIYNLHSDDILMIHLAEYVVSEKQKNINFIQEAKDKQQTIIDITPHQTLSIETTAAAVEEIKELSTNGNLQNIEKDYCEVFFLNDWLSYRVFYQVQFGVQMCNDSANFTKLIGSGGMNIDTLNKIQKEQSIVYDKMVNQELELLKALFRVKYVRESIEPLEYLKMRIENVENELKVTNKETYYDIISTRKERGIKYGARLISPINYYYHNNINVGIIKFYPDSYEGLIKESDVDNNSVYGNDWTFIESKYYFLKWLKRLSIGEFYFEISEENKIIEVTKTTSATVEEGKPKKKCLFNYKQIAIAAKMVNGKTGQFQKPISKTDSDGINKFLKDIDEKFKIGNVPERVVREYNRLIIGKDFFQNISNTDKEGVKKILELGDFTGVLKDIK